MNNKNTNCFCLVTHKYNDFVRKQWFEIMNELRDTNTKPVLLFDFTQLPAENGIDQLTRDFNDGLIDIINSVSLFDESIICNNLGKRGYDIRYYEGIPKLFYGNIMLAYMNFFFANQDFNYYWFKEWDVEYTGSWKYLIDKYENIDDDFISRSSALGTEYKKDWFHYGQWKTTTIPPFKDTEVIVTFNPLTRFSHRALDYLDYLYRQGNSGFYELFLGTVLRRKGFKIGGFREYGDLDMEGFDYLPNRKSLDSSKINKPNKLYHPVKEPVDFRYVINKQVPVNSTSFTRC